MSKFTSEQNKEFWNEFSKKAKDCPYGASGNKHLVEIENMFIESILKKINPKTILDMGCGNGQRTLLFSNYAENKIVGVDYSEAMINEANELLQKQNETIKKKLTFKKDDVNNFTNDTTFDVIISCRCIINQPSHEKQIELFHQISDKLNHNGSLIIAEISMEGMERLNKIRNEYHIPPMHERWHNLHINEKIIFPEIKKIFTIKNIQRVGVFYFISRVLHPALTYPKEPEAEAKINDIAVISQPILDKEDENTLEKYGAHLLMHLIKK